MNIIVDKLTDRTLLRAACDSTRHPGQTPSTATLVVYCITNNVNGKRYIGKTQVGLHVRIINHKASVASGSSMAIHRAMRKYGLDNFRWEVLSTCDDVASLNREEIRLIALHGTMDPAIGYNLTPGGDGLGVGELHPWFGRKHTDATRQTLSEAKKGNKNPRYGKPGTRLGAKATVEQRKKISAAVASRVVGDATRAKHRENTTGDRNPFFGKQHTFSTALAIALSRSGFPDADELLGRAGEVLVEIKAILADDSGVSLRKRYVAIREQYGVSRTLVNSIRSGKYDDHC